MPTPPLVPLPEPPPVAPATVGQPGRHLAKMCFELMAQALGPVLVVDDDADSCALLALVVGMLGCDVLTASDGAQGLELARAHRPSLILLDVMMPVCDGFSFRETQLLTPEIAEIPVILISALPESQILRLRLNGVSAVGKPIDIAELTTQVLAICAPGGDTARRDSGSGGPGWPPRN